MWHGHHRGDVPQGIRRNPQRPSAGFIRCLGERAARIVAGHALPLSLGELSPLGKLYETDAQILLLGAGRDSNTSLHLAEYQVGQADCVLPSQRSTVDIAVDWLPAHRPGSLTDSSQPE